MERLDPRLDPALRRRRAGAARRGDAGGRARDAREEHGHPPRGREVLGVRVVASEQYPKGLGPTLSPLASKLAELGVTPMPKIAFDACSDLAIARALSERERAVGRRGRDGVARLCLPDRARAREARIRDPRRRRRGHVAPGGEPPRRPLALRARRRDVTTTETVAFDLLGEAGTDAFKAVSKLVR